MVISCCVCRVEKGSVQDLNFSFHRIPKNENMKLKWWEAIGKKVYHNAYICSKHFKAEDFKNYQDFNLIRKILKPSTVPSVDIKLRSIKLDITENSSSDKDVLTENKNDERFPNNRLKVDESSISTSLDNPTNKKIVSNKAMLGSTANQTKEKATVDNTSKLLKKQRYQNDILGVVRQEDFISEDAWLKFQKYVDKIKKQYRVSLRKNQRLQHEINYFKDLLKKQLSDDVLEI